jgi:REP element-mobilizing transposase RayT
MPVNKPHLYEPGIYCVTFTCYKWLRLFEIASSYDLVYKWFDLLKEQGHYVTGYVIMPNHIHALIGFAPGNKSINTIIGNGKRFMAYEIVNRLSAAGYDELLFELAEGVNASDRKNGKLHEVFEPGFDVKLCHSYKFINQKLAYIHANPLSKKWSLVEYAGDYMHSSAGYYESGKQGAYEVVNMDDCISTHWFNKYPCVE